MGRYIIRETKAPVFYSVTTQPIEVEIEFSGQIVRVEVLNQSVYTNVSVTKRGYKQVTPVPDHPLRLQEHRQQLHRTAEQLLLARYAADFGGASDQDHYRHMEPETQL